jgi:hypothetical protein
MTVAPRAISASDPDVRGTPEFSVAASSRVDGDGHLWHAGRCRLSRLPFFGRQLRCTRLRHEHRRMAQPPVSPCHGRFCLCDFACAAETESFFSPDVRALMRDDVRVEIVATFGVGHAL